MVSVMSQAVEPRGQIIKISIMIHHTKKTIFLHSMLCVCMRYVRGAVRIPLDVCMYIKSGVMYICLIVKKITQKDPNQQYVSLSCTVQTNKIYQALARNAITCKYHQIYSLRYVKTHVTVKICIVFGCSTTSKKKKQPLY